MYYLSDRNGRIPILFSVFWRSVDGFVVSVEEWASDIGIRVGWKED